MFFVSSDPLKRTNTDEPHRSISSDEPMSCQPLNENIEQKNRKGRTVFKLDWDCP
jgi:hypothetical protein